MNRRVIHNHYTPYFFIILLFNKGIEGGNNRLTIDRCFGLLKKAGCVLLKKPKTFKRGLAVLGMRMV
jgi:hypothetical protein